VKDAAALHLRGNDKAFETLEFLSGRWLALLSMRMANRNPTAKGSSAGTAEKHGYLKLTQVLTLSRACIYPIYAITWVLCPFLELNLYHRQYYSEQS
jgi:hypothetical protein